MVLIGEPARVTKNIGPATVESMTPASGWALGGRFTAADVVFGGELAYLKGFEIMEASPRVAAYVDRVTARPAYQASFDGFWDAIKGGR